MISIQTPYKLKPHIIAESILDVDFQGLKNLGFQHVVFDKDNTLTDHDVHEITNQAFASKIEEIRSIFGKDNVAIFTNNLLVRKVDNCDLEVIQSSSKKKPFAEEPITLHFNDKFLKQNSYCGKYFNPEKCIVVGDRLLTDVAQGHNMKGLSIWVQPWDLDYEQYFIKFPRTYEWTIWKYFMGWATAEYEGKDLSNFSSSKLFGKK